MNDLLVAFGLIGIVVIVFIISQMGLLPKKSLPFVIGALLGAFGWTVWREKRMKDLREDLERREKEIKEREKKAEELKKDYEVADEKLEELKSELKRQRAAYEKEILLLKAKNEEYKKYIDGLSGDELHDEFEDALSDL